MADRLFQLIHSLEASEKRYFKLNAIKKDSQYMALFDIINNQKSYNEEELWKVIKGARRPNKLFVAKNDLYRRVLRSLRAYHYSKSWRQDLSERLDFIEILFNKGEIKLCKHQIELALNKARALDAPDYQLKLYQWKMRLERKRSSKQLEENLREWGQYCSQLIAQLEKENQLVELHDRVYSLVVKKTHLEGGEAEPVIEQILGDEVYLAGIEGLHYDARIIYHSINYYAGLLTGNIELALNGSEDRIMELESNPARNRFNELKYFSAQLQFVDLSNQSGRLLRVENTIEKLHQIAKKNNKLPSDTLVRIYTQELRFYMNSKLMEKARSIVVKIQREFDKDGIVISGHLQQSIRMNVGILHFLMEEFEECRRWMKNILQDKEANIREDVSEASRIIMIIAHFEMEDFDLMESEIRSIKRFLEGKNWPKEFVGIILGLINQLLRQTLLENPVVLYKDLSDNLTQYDRDFVGKHLCFQEVRAWAQWHQGLGRMEDLIER